MQKTEPSQLRIFRTQHILLSFNSTANAAAAVVVTVTVAAITEYHF